MSTDTVKKVGLAPVYDRRSKVLILGSFPSVKSRRIEFYYGNNQNRFWKMICGYFGEEIPQTTEKKKEFLLRREIALWDMATACEIVGSSDSSVRNTEIADLSGILQTADIQLILLNGALAYELFISKYKDLTIAYEKMPSTSPANPRYDEGVWKEALNRVF